MYKECDKLSPLLQLEYPVFTAECENELYNIFCMEYKNAKITYEGLPVFTRKDPLYNGKEETFWHFISDTHQKGHIGEYVIDEIRARRLLWGKDLLLNSPCHTIPHKPDCKGIYIWDYPYKKTYRRKFLHVKYSQLLIIEKRKNYWLFITNHKLDRLHKNFEINDYKSKKQKTPYCLR